MSTRRLSTITPPRSTETVNSTLDDMPAQCAHSWLIRKYLPELAVALTLQDATVADGVVGQDASSTTARQENRLGLISLSCRAARVKVGLFCME